MALAILKDSAKDFIEDECPRLAAALAYYTIFALPPLLILILVVVSTIWDPQTIQRTLESQFADMVGAKAARQIHTMIESADRPGTGGLLPSIMGIAALIFSATGAFVQLQSALNRAWEVEPDPAQGGIKNFVFKRLFSFAMILGIVFLLMVSLILSAGLSAFGEMLGDMLPAGLSTMFLQVINVAISFSVITVLFAALFKVVPDAEIAWKDVWVGAAVTALLFVLGKLAIGMYLGRSNPGEAYGAAGALAVLLLWIYYAGLILLFGAEFTQRWTESRGRSIRPEKGAVRVVEEKVHVRGSEAAS